MAYAASLDASILDGVKNRQATIEELGNRITNDPKADYLAIREQLRLIRDEANAVLKPLRGLRSDLQADLDQLGAAPEQGQNEAFEIASARAALTGQMQSVDDGIRQADLNVLRASRLLQDVSDIRRKAFYDNILKRGASPLTPSVWLPAARSFADGQTKFAEQWPQWWQQQVLAENRNWAFGFSVAAFLFALLMFGPVRNLIDTSFLNRLQKYEPTKSSRIAAAGLRVLGRVVPGVIGGWVVYETMRAQGLITVGLEQIALTVWFGVLGLLFIDGLATAVFAPKYHDWRLVPLQSSGSMIVRLLLLSAAMLFAVDALLNTCAQYLGSTEELARLQGSIVSIIGAALLLALTRDGIWKIDQTRQVQFTESSLQRGKQLRHIIMVSAILAIAAVLVGYGSLARFVVTRIYLIAALIAVAWFVRVVIHEAINVSESRASSKKLPMADAVPDADKLIYFWIGTVTDIVLFALLTPILLIVLGFDWVEVRDWLIDAFFGFKIGTVTISLAQILSAVVSFAIILIATRYIQKGVDRRFFDKARLDEGVRNSFRTLLGYIGLVVGITTAIAVLGINLASLAIVAGALSVGIGFGLQSIVNNFVSGLILLFERPIKVGDWIVVSSGEGIVKRISVRSTEIETWDRSSIIVPNSELISSAVTNWTHKDKFNRVVLPIGVSYNEDPDQVLQTLNQVMADNKRVVRVPAPSIYFKGFGDSSLDFEMRVFIKDINDRIIVQNELRIATFNAFKQAGIEIPFPQRDLHVKKTVTGRVKDSPG